MRVSVSFFSVVLAFWFLLIKLNIQIVWIQTKRSKLEQTTNYNEWQIVETENKRFHLFYSIWPVNRQWMVRYRAFLRCFFFLIRFVWKIQQNLAEQQIKLVGEESNQICTAVFGVLFCFVANQSKESVCVFFCCVYVCLEFSFTSFWMEFDIKSMIVLQCDFKMFEKYLNDSHAAHCTN